MFPDGLPREVIEKIDEIVRLIKNNKLAFFCGAGISVNGPSNLPTGNALVDEILDALEGAYPLSLEVSVCRND